MMFCIFPAQVREHGSAITTMQVVQKVVVPQTLGQRRGTGANLPGCRFVELERANDHVWPGPNSSKHRDHMHFVSHGARGRRFLPPLCRSSGHTRTRLSQLTAPCAAATGGWLNRPLALSELYKFFRDRAHHVRSVMESVRPSRRIGDGAFQGAGGRPKQHLCVAGAFNCHFRQQGGCCWLSGGWPVLRTCSALCAAAALLASCCARPPKRAYTAFSAVHAKGDRRVG